MKAKEPVSESSGDKAQSAGPKARDGSRDQNFRHPNTDRKSSRHAGGDPETDDRRYQDRSRSDGNRGSTSSSSGESAGTGSGADAKTGAGSGGDRSGARANESRSEQARRPSGQDVDAEAWWTILQVAPTATLSQVEAAYKTLLRQYHPDLHMGLAPKLKEAAETETKRVTAAREQAKRALSRT